MKIFLGILFVVACLGIVGYVEDPCTTEGLPQGCIGPGMIELKGE
jgi:hypothetical protein